MDKCNTMKQADFNGNFNQPGATIYHSKQGISGTTSAIEVVLKRNL